MAESKLDLLYVGVLIMLVIAFAFGITIAVGVLDTLNSV